MKHTALMLSAALLALSLTGCGASEAPSSGAATNPPSAQAEATAPQSAPDTSDSGYEATELVGGWSYTSSPDMTQEAQGAFDKAMEGLVGVDYTPVALLGTQVVAGTNYCILCQATVVSPEAQPYYTLVYIYEALDGSAEVLTITDLELGVSAEAASEPSSNVEPELVGGWSYTSSPDMTQEAQGAFDKAMEGLVGVDYTPVALLGTQVVAGTNYCILCQATVVSPEAQPYYTLVYIYEALDGSGEVLTITDLELGV